jgi:galactose mutarotase-like enzyme
MDARIIRCVNSQSQLVVHTDAGCVATSWQVRGQEMLALPLALAEFVKSQKTGGIPLLYPYANRLRADHFTAAGKAVDLSRDGQLKRDANGFPMHGLLIRWADWIVTQPAPDELQASIVWGDHAELFTAYPFAHTLRVRWKLGQGKNENANQIAGQGSNERAGQGQNQIADQGKHPQANPSADQSALSSTLTVTTIIEADKGEDVPLSFGWHPYLVLHDRANAQLQLPARRAIALAQNGLPISNDNSAPWLPTCTQSAVASLDDLFQLDMRGASGAELRNSFGELKSSTQVAPASAPQNVQATTEKLAPTAAIIVQRQRIEMKFLSGYSFMQIYSPAGANFVCFEPMTASISALCDSGAAVVKAGDTFTAAFEIRVF